MKVNKRFQEYVDRKNMWGRKNITFPLKQEDVDYLLGALSCDLSPENLTCDGELAPAMVRSRYNKLSGVVKDLEGYAKKNGLRFNGVYE